MAALCLAGSGAMAQSGPTQLPAVTVDAPAAASAPARRAPARPTPVPDVSPTPVEAATGASATVDPSPGAGQPASAAAQGPAAPGSAIVAAKDANPRANPAAPWQVERSASDKLTEPLIDLSRTVTIIPKEVIEEKGATSLRELVRTTPGLTLGSGEGGNAFGDRVFIRGFDARNDMFIDGVRQSGVTTREMFNTEQVEVVAGPSGSISGRGTAGGAINIVTKKPLEQDFYNADMTVGTDWTKRFTGDVNYNVSDKFAFRVNLLAQGADVAGRDYVYDNRYGISLAGLWKPADNVRVSLDTTFVYFNQLPDWGVPFDPTTRQPFTKSGVNRSNYYGIPSRDFQNNWQEVTTAGVEWDVNDWIKVSNRTRYSYTVTDYVAGKPGTPNMSNRNPALWTVASTPASRYQINQTIANVTDSTWTFDTGAFNHTLVAGMELSRELVSQDSYNGLAIECFPNCTSTAATGINLNLWNPEPGYVGSSQSPTRANRPADTTVNTLSLYALDTIKWNERLFLNLGTRVDNYNISRTPYASATVSNNSNIFNWNAGLLYKVMPNLSAYIAYGTSSNPVGSELDAGSDAYGGLELRNSVFKPELNTAFEAGLKWEVFDRRLLLTAAIFQTTKQNARETVGPILMDTAAYRVRGVELGWAGAITDRWSLFGGAVFLNTRMTESALPDQVGLPLANVANTSFNILSKYKVTDKLSLGAQATYKGEILGGTLQAVSYPVGTVNVAGVTQNTPSGYNRLPGGWRFDLMADYKINENLTAKFMVLNLFNATLYDAMYRSNSPYVYIQPGRVAYATLSAKF